MSVERQWCESLSDESSRSACSGLCLLIGLVVIDIMMLMHKEHINIVMPLLLRA